MAAKKTAATKPTKPEKPAGRSNSDPMTLANAGKPKAGEAPGAKAYKDTTPPDAPLYEALTPVFIGGRLVQAGGTFRSEDKPGKSWLLVEEKELDAEQETVDEIAAGDATPDSDANKETSVI